MKKTTCSIAPRSEPAGFVEAAARAIAAPARAASPRLAAASTAAPPVASAAASSVRRSKRVRSGIMVGRLTSASIRAGSLLRTLPIRGPTGWCTTVPAGGGRRRARSSSMSSLAGSSQRSKVAGSRITGMRSWMPSMSAPPGVVMTVQLRT